MRLSKGIPRRAIAAALAGIFMTWPAVSEATEFIFTRIVDSHTAIPGGTGTFTGFSTPAIDRGDVAFRGEGAKGQRGIYIKTGQTLRVAVDTKTAFPGGAGTFTRFGDTPSFDGENVAFLGFRGTESGIYTSIGDRLSVVADTNTVIPGGTETFASFSRTPLVSGGRVVFVGTNGLDGEYSQNGVYTDLGGALRVVADRNTAIPGSIGSFDFQFTVPANVPAIEGSTIVFAFTGGIYSEVEGKLHLVADRNTAILGGTGTFRGFGEAVVSNSKVAFISRPAGQAGVYTNLGGSLRKVADVHTAIPGGNENFSRLISFNGLSIDGDRIAFSTGDRTGSDERGGIYLEIGRRLEKVIEVGDLLDEKIVNHLQISPQSLDGKAIAFHARFTDGSQGIFRADFRI